MRLRCALCGKPTSHFVMVGREPAGPQNLDLFDDAGEVA